MNLIRPNLARPQYNSWQSWFVSRRLRHSLLRLIVCVSLTTALASVPISAADMLVLPLAQAAPVKVPPNVRKAGRMYVLESVVVLVLFGGGLYAVCRSSRRT